MSTLREKVAQAICKVKIGGPYPSDERIADAALAAFRAWLADEGLVVVPAMPTEQMQKVGSEARWVTPLMNPDSPFDMYRAMISAAPDALRAEGE